MTSVSNINTGGTYNIIQTVYTLSMLSNSANSIPYGSVSHLEEKLAGDITAGMQSAAAQIGPWTTAWGPVVFQNTGSHVVDNAMYVAYNQTANVYVVAIAATNMQSKYDINDLDLNVGSMVAFPLGITPQNSTQPATQNVGNVSAGAALGVTNLLNMMDPTTNQSLQTFLNGKANTGATLIFTGHSLGGSLSPTLAAWLYPSAPAGWSAIYIVPTAGPSTGDQGFCSNFSEVFPPYTIDGIVGYGAFNQIIWNNYDCVPHAWTNIMNVQPPSTQNDIVWDPITQNGTIVSCQSVYGLLTQQNNTAQEVYSEIDSIYELPQGQTYIKLANLMFTPTTQPGNITSKAQFEKTMGQQHTIAYSEYFGVSTGKGEAQIGVAILSAPSKS